MHYEVYYQGKRHWSDMTLTLTQLRQLACALHKHSPDAKLTKEGPRRYRLDYYYLPF